MTHVLVVEDDAAIRSLLLTSLTDQGMAVSSAADGLSGLQQAIDTRPDLVLLDLGLPGLDGQTVLSMLRAVNQTPVIVITAQDDDPSVIRALDAGADDYMVKPFTVGQLTARIRAVLRRAQDGPDDAVVSVGALRVDCAGRQATLDGTRLDLTRLEFDLLLYLAERSGEVVTKRELLTEVWQQTFGGEHTVDVHISWLRRKLGETASDPVLLHSVRGVGVRLGPAALDPTS